MYILGIWDGHDAGACIVEDGALKVAINEERLTRKKLDIGFPVNSILACLNYMGLNPEDVKFIACCGSQLSRALARTFSYLDKEFYNFRRRKTKKPRFEKFRRLAKYRLTEIGSGGLSKRISVYQIRKRLNSLGFRDFNFFVVDHHTAHAASSALTSGLKKSLCITLDGVGDGLSGTVSIFDDGFEFLSKISAYNSLGLAYEQVTTLLGMRELEDEGKTMCLADYSYPIKDVENKMMDFYKVCGLSIVSKYSTLRRFLELEKILWNTQRERFAHMTQKILEKNMLDLFANAVNETGIKNVCWSGGVASNIKANRIIRMNTKMKDWFIFPHMGDGGLAVGAALYISHKLMGTNSYKISDVYFGPDFTDNDIKEALKISGLDYEYREDLAKLAGDLISEGHYLFWFQGRMELGPRALGNRSILAPTGSEEIKNELNLHVKKREWFQPFCPSLLENDAKKVFEDYDKPDKFMTMGFMARNKIRDDIKSVIHVDGSSRPQMVGLENKKFMNLIKQVKKNTGLGTVLNTSLNIHGEPIVCSPIDAIDTMIRTKTKYMFLGNYFVELK